MARRNRNRPRGGRGDTLRRLATGSLWPIPAAAVAGAVVLGFVLPGYDQSFISSRDELALAFSGGAPAARGILQAIATSIISVTTLLFSLTIVTLQLASSQYSPRLLQTFVRDRVVQVCLGVQLATFVYALVVLRSVRSPGDSGAGGFVPRISVTVALGLTLCSVVALVVFLSHQVRQLRVETMMRDVHDESNETWRRLQRRQGDDQPDVDLPPVPESARPVCARGNGFLVEVREKHLLDAACAADAVLLIERRPGEPVITGTPLGWAWPAGDGGDVPVDDLERALGEHVVLEYERENVTDPSYGLRKLVDIAARALSPGINDPTTASHALSHVSALLGQTTSRDAWHRRLRDGSGTDRLVLRSWDFPALLDLAFAQVRHYGRDDSRVVERLFQVLAEVAWRARTDGQREAVEHQRRVLADQFTAAPPPGTRADDIRAWARNVEEALAGRWARPGSPARAE